MPNADSSTLHDSASDMCIPSWAVDISPNSKVNLALRQLCRFWLARVMVH